MKKQRGEPLVVLEVEERKLLDKLLTQTYKPYEFASSHRRLFTKVESVDDMMSVSPHWTYKDQDTFTIPRSALLRNIREARAALKKADDMLEAWQTDIKSL